MDRTLLESLGPAHKPFMTEKLFITANDLLADSYTLALSILRSGFAPTHLVGVWRGGAPVAVAVEEALRYHGVEAEHMAVKTSAYEAIDTMKREISVEGLSYLVPRLSKDSRLLIIDDVFDRGHSLDTLIAKLREQCGQAMPDQVKTACVWYKPSRRETELTPDWYVHETERWLVFPHELIGLSAEEVAQHKAVPGDFLELAGSRPAADRK